MDISEFTHQVSILLSTMRDPKDDFLGKYYMLTFAKATVIESLVYQPTRDGRDSHTYTTKLIATPSPDTRARITIPLLDKLGILKIEGLGGKTTYLGVEYQFVVQDSEPQSASFSSSSLSERELEDHVSRLEAHAGTEKASNTSSDNPTVPIKLEEESADSELNSVKSTYEFDESQS